MKAYEKCKMRAFVIWLIYVDNIGIMIITNEICGSSFFSYVSEYELARVHRFLYVKRKRSVVVLFLFLPQERSSDLESSNFL